eukprot:6598955-Prymnesium_polylepis.1
MISLKPKGLPAAMDRVLRISSVPPASPGIFIWARTRRMMRCWSQPRASPPRCASGGCDRDGCAAQPLGLQALPDWLEHYESPRAQQRTRTYC